MRKNFKELGQILAENSRDISMIADSMVANEYLVVPIGLTRKPVSLDEAVIAATMSDTPCVVVRVMKSYNANCRIGVVKHALSKLNNKRVYVSRANEDGLVKCADVDNAKCHEYIHKRFIEEVKL